MLRRLRDRRSRGAVALLAMGLAALPARAQCQYEVTATLQYPINCSFDPVATIGIAMNSHGAVVGYYKCPIWTHMEAFLWTPEDGFTTLQRPPGVVSASASDINDDGVICGSMVVDPVGYRGFVYDHGVWTELPPVIPEQGFSYALAISNAGVVVGQRAIVPNSAPYNAYIWSAPAGFLDLGVMEGPYSTAIDLTESGLVVGSTGNGNNVSDGFVIQDASLAFLGPIPGGFTSAPESVSENGAVVGAGRIPMRGYTFGVNRAFLWKHGQFKLLGTLSSDVASQAHSVNGRGQAVGRSYNVPPYDNVSRGFLWQHGAMVDLNTLVAGPGIYMNDAGLVTDDGTILAYSVGRTLLLRPVGVPLGDLDLDCRVSTADFLALLIAWGPCAEAGGCPADLNGDAVVDFFDLLILLENWG